MATRNPHPINPIKINWAIKGYHIFHIRPPLDTALLLVRDPTNRYDPYAMNVLMPNTAQLPPNIRHLGAHQVGRVPANLCRCFCLLEDRELLVGDITCRYSGRVGPSQDPPAHVRFRRGGHGGLDRAGGGADLAATYHLTVPTAQLQEAMQIFETNLQRADLHRFAV